MTRLLIRVLRSNHQQKKQQQRRARAGGLPPPSFASWVLGQQRLKQQHQHQQCRRASSRSFDDAHRRLSPLARAIPLNASEAKVRLLRDPTEFYETLLASITRARRHISLSALYLGTDALEQRLVARLDEALTSQPELTVRLLFDGSRALRKSRESGASTVSLLLPLLRKHGPDRIELHLCTMPAARRAAKLSSLLGEVAGVCHVKAFVADDEVIVTGANLSTEYFRDRQDRYVHIGHGRGVAEWYHGLVEALGRCADTVEAGATPASEPTANYALRPAQHPHDQWRDVLERLVQPPAAAAQEGAAPHDTYVFPTIQCGPVGMDHDARVVHAALDSVPADGVVRLATAYLNPPPPLISALAGAAPRGEVSILTAHRDSHGFQSARGLLSYVVDCYVYIESQQLRPALQAASQAAASAASATTATTKMAPAAAARYDERPVQIQGYRREGWTYHAKGLWVAPSASEPCFLSIAGSSNFGRRSFERDLEAQMVILSEEPDLRAALDEEWARLCAHRAPTAEELAFDGAPSNAQSAISATPPPRFAASYLTKLGAWLL